jgi:hypothetical protein
MCLASAALCRQQLELLGYQPPGEDTVLKYMVKPRQPREPSTTWLPFLRNHLEVSWAIDFLTRISHRLRASDSRPNTRTFQFRLNGQTELLSPPHFPPRSSFCTARSEAHGIFFILFLRWREAGVCKWYGHPYHCF